MKNIIGLLFFGFCLSANQAFAGYDVYVLKSKSGIGREATFLTFGSCAHITRRGTGGGDNKTEVEFMHYKLVQKNCDKFTILTEAEVHSTISTFQTNTINPIITRIDHDIVSHGKTLSNFSGRIAALEATTNQNAINNHSANKVLGDADKALDKRLAAIESKFTCPAQTCYDMAEENATQVNAKYDCIHKGIEDWAQGNKLYNEQCIAKLVSHGKSLANSQDNNGVFSLEQITYLLELASRYPNYYEKEI